MSDDVKVDLDVMSTYSKNMSAMSLHGSQETILTLNEMATSLRDAFTSFSTGAVFAEGQMMSATMLDRMTQTGAFIADSVKGFQCLSSASGAIRTSYSDTDTKSAQTINDVNYAFGDPNANPPAIVDKLPAEDRAVWGKTFSDAAAEDLANQKQTPVSMAATLTTDQATSVISAGPYVTVYRFADGSEVMRTSAYGSGTTEEARTADGKTLYVTNTITGTDASGNSYVQTSQQVGPSGGTSDTTSTRRTTLPSGDIAIEHTVTHHNPTNDPNLRTDGTVDSTYQVVSPSETQSTPKLQPGPVEEAQRDLGLPSN